MFKKIGAKRSKGKKKVGEVSRKRHRNRTPQHWWRTTRAKTSLRQRISYNHIDFSHNKEI